VKRDRRDFLRKAVIVVTGLMTLSGMLGSTIFKASRRSEPPPPPPVVSDDSGDRGCTRDEDCSPSRTCTYCGQCFSRQPRLETDCKMYCLNVPSCACIQGTCQAAGDAGGSR
jgi:hypothetical protein